MEETLDPEPRQLKRCKPAEAHQWDIPPPPTITQPNKRPTPYLPNLTPMPSPLRPHCLAKDRLRLWAPAIPQPPVQGNSVLSEAEHTRIKDTMIHAWEEDMRASYGAGLLMWHCFCDSKGVPEPDRAPASQTLLSAFVAHMAAAYSGKTVAGYLSGVRAWHLLHGVPWVLEKKEMDTMLRAADKLAPRASKKKKRLPYTPTFIAAIQQNLDLNSPLDAAVFACLTTCFYASARLGKFTVRTLAVFSPDTHITTQNLSYNQDRNGLKVTVLHLPRTKAAGHKGEDVLSAK
jgi:hypothetical protein